MGSANALVNMADDRMTVLSNIASNGFPQAAGQPRIGLAVLGLWAFMLIAVSRIGEIVPGLGSIPIAKVAIAFCILGLMLQRQAWSGVPARSLPLVRLATVFLILAALGVPLSIWKSNSAKYFFTTALVVASGFLLTVKLANARQILRPTINVLIAAGLIQAVAALSTGQGRISAGSSYDPNDLAYLLVTVLPLVIANARLTHSLLIKLINYATALAFVITALLTQSRGGLLGLAAEAVYLVVWPLPVRGQPLMRRPGGLLKRLATIFLLAVVVWSLLPGDARDRLSTVTDLGNDYNADTTLKTGRLAIWERNVKAGFERPIGYGIDSFGVVDMRHGGKFKAAHNSVVEVFVELGLAGVIVFLMTYVRGWRCLQPSPETDFEGHMILRALRAGLLANFVSGFFLSQAYSVLLWTFFAVIALSSRNYAAVQRHAPGPSQAPPRRRLP